MSALRRLLLLLPAVTLVGAWLPALAAGDGPDAGMTTLEAPAAPPAAIPAPLAAIPAPPPKLSVDQDPLALTALFHRRDEAAQLQLLEKALDAGLKARPDDFELLIRKAQLRWNQADRVSGKAREALGKEVWALGERAAKLKPHRVEGHYWAAVGVGAYSQGVGLLAAITQGLEGRFNGFLDRAIQLDPTYLDAAPLTAKGRAFFELPWPKRNLDKSAELLQRATSKGPNNLRAWLYLAETQLERGKPQEASAALAHALKDPGSADRVEGRFVRGMAKALEPKVNAKLASK